MMGETYQNYPLTTYLGVPTTVPCVRVRFFFFRASVLCVYGEGFGNDILHMET